MKILVTIKREDGTLSQSYNPLNEWEINETLDSIEEFFYEQMKEIEDEGEDEEMEDE